MTGQVRDATEQPTPDEAYAWAATRGLTIARDDRWVRVLCRCEASLWVPASPWHEATAVAEVIRWAARHGR